METSLHLEKLQKIYDQDHHHWLLAHLPPVCFDPDDTHHWDSITNSDISINSNNSIDAYPLVDGKDPTEVEEATSEVKLPNKKRLTPTSIMVVDTISEVKSRVLLKVLFDPGSTATLINCKCLPRNCKACPIKQECKINTLAGSCETKSLVVMRNLRLPELDKNRVGDQQKTLVFDGQCKYDVILGADFLSKSGIDIKYSTGRHWIGGKTGGKFCLLQGIYFGVKIISAMIRHIFSRVERSFTFGDHTSVPPIFAN